MGCAACEPFSHGQAEISQPNGFVIKIRRQAAVLFPLPSSVADFFKEEPLGRRRHAGQLPVATGKDNRHILG
jgi:hypothetical protein